MTHIILLLVAVGVGQDEVKLSFDSERIIVDMSPKWFEREVIRDKANYEVLLKDRDDKVQPLSIKSIRWSGASENDEGKKYSSVALRPTRRFTYGTQYKVRVRNLFKTEQGNERILESKWMDTPIATPEGLRIIDFINGPILDIDIRTTEGSASDVGVDYQLQLFSLEALNSKWGTDTFAWLDLKATSRGYIKNQDSKAISPTLDSIISKFDLSQDILFRSDTTLASLLFIEAHVQNEATQDFESSTYTLGAGISTSLGFLVPFQPREEEPTWLQQLNFLDLATPKRPIEAPRLYIGYDRVFRADDTNRQARTGEDDKEFNRLHGAVAWILPVLTDKSYLRIAWEGFLDVDAKRDRLKQLVEVSLTYNLSEESSGKKGPVSLVVKYVSGSLPPEFGRESAVVAGITISLN